MASDTSKAEIFESRRELATSTFLAQDHRAARVWCQAGRWDLSKLDRNVPFLTPLEMSPFCVLSLFSFLAVSFEKFRVRRPRNDDSDLARPTASPFLLARCGAQPCGARRAELLGRSGGPGQQRARCAGGPLGVSLLRLAPDRLMPRMVCWRHPLPFFD